MAKSNKITKTTVSKTIAHSETAAATACDQPVADAARKSASGTALYQVLEPFWLGCCTVKPVGPDGASVWIEMTPAEARIYQDAGVLGTEPNVVHDDAGR